MAMVVGVVNVASSAVGVVVSVVVVAAGAVVDAGLGLRLSLP